MNCLKLNGTCVLSELLQALCSFDMFSDPLSDSGQHIKDFLSHFTSMQNLSILEVAQAGEPVGFKSFYTLRVDPAVK